MLMNVNRLSGGGGSSRGGAQLPAVLYSGAVYLEHAGALTGAGNGRQWTTSFHFRLDAIRAVGSATQISYGNGFLPLILINTSEKLEVRFRDSTGANILLFQSTTSFTADAVWRHIAISVDTNFGAGAKLRHVYINRSPVAGTWTDAQPAFDINIAAGDWTGENSVSSVPAIAFSNHWEHATYMDFSVSTNLDKFVTAASLPIDLGATGTGPTGSQPLIFLNNPAASRGTNSGSGGNFVLNGTITDTAGPV